MSQIRNFRSSPTRARNPTEFSDTRRPPRPWIVRYSRTINPGIPYYFNPTTNKSQWKFPEDDYIELSQYTHPPPPPPPPPAPALSIHQLSMPNQQPNQPPNQPLNTLLSQPSTTIPELCNGGLCPNMTTTQPIPPPSMDEVIERLSSEPPGAILREIRRRRFSKNEINNVNNITRFLSYLEAFDKTKHIIEQRFPNLDQYIIDDAFKDAIFAFTNNPLVSEEDAKSEFFNVMMNSINERKIQPGTLTNLMLLRERSYQMPLASNKAQDLTSAFMKLPSRPLEMIAEKLAEQANKFNHNKLRFPRLPKKVDDIIPVYIMFTKDPNRLNKYFYLNDKLREQLIYIERLLSIEPFTSDYPYPIPGDSRLNYNETQNVQLQIFEEFYRLTKLNLNANELERLIIESVITIIRNSSMSREQMRHFILNFADTINNQENYRYCNKVAEEFK
jgi:hypothetical protein